MRKLGQTRLFYGFTPLEIRTLCQALCAKTVVYEPGDRIFQQDELPEYAALILEGDVWCIRYDDEGNACPLFLLEEGDLACSLSLFCTTPFPYTACARKKTTVLSAAAGVSQPLHHKAAPAQLLHHQAAHPH